MNGPSRTDSAAYSDPTDGAIDIAPFMEDALECVVEDILEYGQWPKPRKAPLPHICRQFDLYDWLDENDDPSHRLEFTVAALASKNMYDLSNLKDREEKRITAKLTEYLKGSEIVAEYALTLAEEERG